MHIFIDESGPFELEPKLSPFSCVGALVIPSAQLADVFLVTQFFKDEIGLGRSELKGKDLASQQVSALIELIAKNFDVMFEVSVYCAQWQSRDDLEEHRGGAAEGVMASVTREFDPSLVQDMDNLRRGLLSLNLKLYAQVQLTTQLVNRVLCRAPLYYVQRYPRELGAFTWEFDAKNVTPIQRGRFRTYEEIFDAVMMPWLQSASLNDPGMNLEGADYSSFQRFQGTYDEVPEHLAHKMAERAGPFHHTKLNEIFENRSYPASHHSLGLQLADCFANLAKRALNGAIEPDVVREFPRLMVNEERGRNVFQFIVLGGRNKGERAGVVTGKAREFTLHCDHHAKGMLLPQRP